MFNHKLSDNTIIVRRTSAIGDCLSSTVVADRLIELGYEVAFQSHPANHCVLRRHGRLSAINEPNGYCHVNLDGAYENDSGRRGKHFNEMWFERASGPLYMRGIVLGPPLNCKPTIRVQQNDREAAGSLLSQYPKPWVFVCPRSDSYNVRQVPDGIWGDSAPGITGTKFWIGRHPAPNNFIDLKCQHLDTLISYLSNADLLISVDTGPLHIGAALGIPILAIGQSSSPDLHLSDQRDFQTIEPKLGCLNCQKNVCPISQWEPPCQKIDPDFIAGSANDRLRSIHGNDVSAIISVYRPDSAILNRCLQQILPQVQEVIVCRDKSGTIPSDVNRDGKIKFLVNRQSDIGYGRKANYAARHSNGRWLLFLNDDAFMNPGAVEAMRREMIDGVGMVAPLLRYPSGRIYHAGKVRAAGVRGWGHIDHQQYEHTFKEPTEVENSCGACVMVRRTAFYQAGCFDEDYKLYCEDDSLALSVRREGYRIIFTPFATGIHEEHLSTRKTEGIVEIMHRSNALFTKKWSAYLDHNANRVPLGDFDYLKL